MNKHLKNGLFWAMPATWMGLIFLSSRMPYDQQDIKPALASRFDLTVLEPFFRPVSFTYHQATISVEALGIERFVEFLVRKGAHVAVFFVLTLLFVYAFKKTTDLPLGKVFLYSFLMSVGYACIDEMNQSFTPNRTPYIGDVVLDSVGSLLAIIGLYVARLFRKQS